jgi:hypothetical protein
MRNIGLPLDRGGSAVAYCRWSHHPPFALIRSLLGQCAEEAAHRFELSLQLLRQHKRGLTGRERRWNRPSPAPFFAPSNGR